MTKRHKKPKPRDFEPEQFFPADHKTWPGAQRCTAWNPNHGRQCGKPAMKGRTKCERCGGKTPRGPQSPNFKTGRYSKDLPTRLLTDFQQALEDQQWLSLRPEIALIHTRLSVLLRRSNTVESARAWEEIGKLAGKLSESLALYKVATSAKDDSAIAKHFYDIEQAVIGIEDVSKVGMGESAIWTEIGKQVDRIQKLTASDSKRQIELQRLITVERALLLYGALIEEFRLSVAEFADRQTAKQILDRAGRGAERLLSPGEFNKSVH